MRCGAPSLEFTPENYEAVVTVAAQDDDIVDGPQSCQVTIGRTQSDDPLYDHLIPSPVEVIVLDDDPEDASIGDYVWLDQNGDGIQDAAEPGIPDVTVFLDLDGNGALDDSEPFTTTNASGIYIITNLTAGIYSVHVYTDTVPTGYALTTNNLPLPVTLAEEESYDSAGFGYEG